MNRVPDIRGVFQQWSHHLPYLALCLSAIAFVLYALYFDGPYSVYDDSFISFRYAHNLARGHGLVFNPGERVEGYTNFLWTMLMAGAIAVGADVVMISKVAAAVAGIATLWLAFHLGRQELDSRWSGAVIAGMLAMTASFARYAVSGMETLLYGMLVMLGLYLYLHSLKANTIPFVAGIVLALAAMTRPEGALIYGIVTLHFILILWLRPHPTRKRLVYLSGWLAGYGVVYAPYFAWRYAYYGYLLPNTFYAKVGQPGLAMFVRGLLYLRDVLLLLNPQAVLCLVLGLFWRGRRATQTLLFGLVGVYLGYLVAVGGDQQAFFGPRFVLPLLPLIYTLGAGGALGLAIRLGQRRQRWLYGGLISALVCIFALWSSFERQGYKGLQNTMHRGWVTVGHWLTTQAQPIDTLAVEAAGIIPFYTDLYTIDMLGLNDLHIAHLDMPTGGGLAGHEKTDPAYILARRPTYLATWLDQHGRTTYSGPQTAIDQLQASYTLWAIVLMRPPIEDEPTLIVNPTYSLDLHQRGYIYGVFRRKDQK